MDLLHIVSTVIAGYFILTMYVWKGLYWHPPTCSEQRHIAIPYRSIVLRHDPHSPTMLIKQTCTRIHQPVSMIHLQAKMINSSTNFTNSPESLMDSIGSLVDSSVDLFNSPESLVNSSESLVNSSSWFGNTSSEVGCKELVIAWKEPGNLHHHWDPGHLIKYRRYHFVLQIEDDLQKPASIHSQFDGLRSAHGIFIPSESFGLPAIWVPSRFGTNIFDCSHNASAVSSSHGRAIHWSVYIRQTTKCLQYTRHLEN